MGISLPEVFILRELRKTFREQAPNKELLEALFEDYADDPEDGLFLKDIVHMFQRMALSKNPAERLKFIYNFPRQLSDYPCVSVTLAQDVPFLRPIGKHIKDIDNQSKNPDGSYVYPHIVEEKGVVMNQSYAIGVYTFNPLVTIFIYDFLKYFLLVADDEIQILQAFEYSGQDIMPMTEFLPPEIFGRNIMLTAEGVFDTAPVKFKRVLASTVVLETPKPGGGESPDPTIVLED